MTFLELPLLIFILCPWSRRTLVRVVTCQFLSDTFWYGSRAARFSCEFFLFRASKSDLPGAIWTEFAKVENYRQLEPIRVDPESSSPYIAAVSKRIMSRNKRNENYMKMFWLNWQLLAYFCYKSHTCNFHPVFRFSRPKLKDSFCNCVSSKCHFCMLRKICIM